MPDVKKHNWMYYGNTQGIVCSLSQRVFIQSLPHLVKKWQALISQPGLTTIVLTPIGTS